MNFVREQGSVYLIQLPLVLLFVLRNDHVDEIRFTPTGHWEPVLKAKTENEGMLSVTRKFCFWAIQRLLEKGKSSSTLQSFKSVIVSQYWKASSISLCV